jgi:molecular chaperone GrpE (heat shock protein)
MDGSGSGGIEDGLRSEPGVAKAVASGSIFEGVNVVTDALTEDHEGDGRTGRENQVAAEVAPDATSALIEVASSLENLNAKQDDLKALFEARIRSDEVQAKALERLHDQVREYKANFIRQEMQPLLRDLIFCYDFADDEFEQAGRRELPASSVEMARAFGHIRQMVADVLAKYDVEPYRSAGPDFDRREQQCVRTVPTPIMADEKKIAAVGAVGFRIGDQIVRKEQVTVYKYGSVPSTAGREAAPSLEKS